MQERGILLALSKAARRGRGVTTSTIRRLSTLLIAFGLASCATRSLRQPLVHEVHINPSANAEADLASIDVVARSFAFVPLPQDHNVGKSGRMTCVGTVDVLKSYRYSDAVGFYVVRFKEGGLLSVAFADTAEPGQPTPEISHDLFVKLAKGLIARFGKERTSVPPMEADCVIWNGVNLDISSASGG